MDCYPFWDKAPPKSFAGEFIGKAISPEKSSSWFDGGHKLNYKSGEFSSKMGI